jgi:acetyltransferase
VVGVSEDPLKYGSRLARSVVETGYRGDLYFVNQKAGTYLGHKFVSSLADAGPVDLVVVSVPNVYCADVIDQAGSLGCGAAVVVANGFAEIGRRDLQDDVASMARKWNLPLVGPNCMGLYAGPALLNAMGDSTIPPGRVAVVAQSGNVGIAIYQAAKSTGVGLSYFVSLGNQVDVAFDEVLDYLRTDESTDVVLLYIEGIRGLGRFLETAAVLADTKPVVALRGGRTAAGARSALSHTGSLAGDEVVIGSALRRAGIIEVDSPNQLLACAMALADPTPMRGRRVSVVADSGGYATLGADAAARAGLDVSAHSAQLQQRLRTVVPQQASIVNPVDLIGGPEIRPDIFQRAVEACLRDPAIDAAVLVGAYGGYGDFGGPVLTEREVVAGGELVALRDQLGKPLVVQSIYANVEHAGIDALRRGGVPVVEDLGDAMNLLALKADRSKQAARPRHEWTPAAAMSAPIPSGVVLTEDDGRRWFEAHVPGYLGEWRVVESEDEALAAAAEFGHPVVMKVRSTAASHKSDVGGVILNLRTDHEVRTAWGRLAEISAELGTPPAALVTTFETGRYEALVGSIRHPELGAVIAIGSGGLFAESLVDREILFPPLVADDVSQALQRLTLGRVLASSRATPQMRQRFVELVIRVGDLVIGAPEVVELDLNPVLLSGTGAVVLDVRVVVSE